MAHVSWAYVRAVLKDGWHLAAGTRLDHTLLFVLGGVRSAAVFCFFDLGVWIVHYRSSGICDFCGAI